MPYKVYIPGETLNAADLNSSIAELVNTTASYTFTGIHTHNADIIGNYKVTDRLGNVRSVTRETAKPNGYQVKSTDNGRMIYATGDVMIPANIFGIGDNVTIYNSTGSAITIKQGGGTLMYLSGLGISGDAVIDSKGLCTVLCVDLNIYVITTTSITTSSSGGGGGGGSVTQSQIVAALGYFPYSQSNPAFLANSTNDFGVSQSGLLNSLGYTPLNAANAPFTGSYSSVDVLTPGQTYTNTSGKAIFVTGWTTPSTSGGQAGTITNGQMNGIVNGIVITSGITGQGAVSI